MEGVSGCIARRCGCAERETGCTSGQQDLYLNGIEGIYKCLVYLNPHLSGFRLSDQV